MVEQRRYTRRAVITGAIVGGAVAVGGKVLIDQLRATSSTGCVWAVQVNDNLPIGGDRSSYWPYVSELEQKLGRAFAGWRRNGITGSDDLAVYRRAYDRGWHWSYANGKIQPSDSSGNPIAARFWYDTAAGKYDSFYRMFFKSIKADPRWTEANPFHFSFHHEQYVKSEGGGIGAGSAPEYIAAFRRVAGIMDAEAAHASKGGNMLRAWVPHWRQYWGDPIYGSGNASSAVAPLVVSKVYPGSDVVDKIGSDIALEPAQTYSASSQWKPVHDFALAKGKSFFTGETGIDGSDEKVVTYLRELDTLLKGWGAGTGPGQVEAICWTTRVAADGDYRIDKTRARLAQYKRMALDAFYAATT